jgi:hypothetical protein
MIPSYVRPFLWSYDTRGLDVMRDKKRIITNVLNMGSFEATKWLFQTYDRSDLKSAVANPLPGDWSKKSLNFWRLIFDVTPKSVSGRTLR